MQVLGRLLVQVVSQILIEAGQVLHLHLNPVLSQVVMAFEFIPAGTGQGTEIGSLLLRCTCAPEPATPLPYHPVPQTHIPC